MKSGHFVLPVVFCALAAFTTTAHPQQTPQGQTPPGTDLGPQKPDPTNIPEKFGPPLQSTVPAAPTDRGVPDAGQDRPAQQGLELREKVPNTGGTTSETPAKPQ
jgi:hypothetical protein